MARLKPSQKKEKAFIETIVQKEFGLQDPSIGFSSNIFMLFGLPTQKLSNEKKQWIKENRNYEFTVTQLDKNHEIPYGCYARINQIFIDTEVKTKGTNVIELGNSFNQYIKKLGYEEGRAYKGVRRQLANLIRCAVSIRAKTNLADVGVQTLIGRKWFIGLDEKSPDQPELFQSRILLDEEYAKYIYKHAVPLDMDVVKYFKRNPLALDFYRFLAYRNNGLSKTLVMKDSDLFVQLGSEMSDHRKTRERLRAILKQVQSYWKVKARFEDGLFFLHPSPPAVPPKALQKRPIQITHNLGDN